jgi:hypothetical protein
VITKLQSRAALTALATLCTVVAAAGPAAADVGGGPQPEGPYCARIEKSVSCSVVEPVVTQRATAYPIVVHRNDRIKVTAAGCVQTGGRGLTWKRYLDPQSGKDLYHGLIDIPGVTGGLQRIQGIDNTWFQAFGDGNIILGYEDDGYSDNGYYAPDDGTDGQCRGVGNARVSILIERH